MTIPRLRGWLAPAAAGLWVLAAAPPVVPEEAPAPAPVEEAKAPAEAELPSGASPALREALDIRREANRVGVATQERIEKISDETDDLAGRHAAALDQLASLRIYNDSMRELIASQDAELGSLRDQVDRIDVVGRSVTPLMLRMIDAIEAFVALDVPFLLEERKDRVAQLRTLMARADVSLSEKYRRIMEAYQIEGEYGRTIEAYRAPLAPGGDGSTVDFLRFGRVSLVYLTLDEERAGAWDARSGAWVELDSDYVSDVRAGLRIARKQIAPDLIALPLPEPDELGGEG